MAFPVRLLVSAMCVLYSEVTHAKPFAEVAAEARQAVAEAKIELAEVRQRNSEARRTRSREITALENAMIELTGN